MPGKHNNAQDRETYGKEFDGLAALLEAVEARLGKIADERQARAARKARILRFLEEPRQADGLITEFDEQLWYAIVGTVTVYKDGGEVRAGGDGK